MLPLPCGRECHSATQPRKQLSAEHDPERNIRGALTPECGIEASRLENCYACAEGRRTVAARRSEYPRRHKIEVTGVITLSAPRKRKKMMQSPESEGIHKGARPSPLMRKGRSGTVNRQLCHRKYPPRTRKQTLFTPKRSAESSPHGNGDKQEVTRWGAEKEGFQGSRAVRPAEGRIRKISPVRTETSRKKNKCRA